MISVPILYIPCSYRKLSVWSVFGLFCIVKTQSRSCVVRIRARDCRPQSCCWEVALLFVPCICITSTLHKGYRLPSFQMIFRRTETTGSLFKLTFGARSSNAPFHFTGTVKGNCHYNPALPSTSACATVSRLESITSRPWLAVSYPKP